MSKTTDYSVAEKYYFLKLGRVVVRGPPFEKYCGTDWVGGGGAVFTDAQGADQT
jgi:hypothetical protein